MPRTQAPLRIALVYVVAGALWISVSDWLLLSLSPNHFEIGQAVKGLVFVLLSGLLIFTLVRREFRERVKLEAEQEDLQNRLAGAQRLEAIGRLTGGIAHDFNNLLTAITGNLENYMGASRDGGPSEHDVTALEEAASAARRAEELTGQLLAFGRGQALRPQPLDVNDVIDEMGQLLHRLIGDRVEVETRLQEDLWVVTTDRGPLQQVVMNLALNARDAMSDGDRLTFSTLNVSLPEDRVRNFDFPIAAGDYVRLRVEDTGAGMDAETRERIYEPFFTTKERHVGTGLGMSTVYGIVKQSGGYIDVESTLGEGTRFDLYFPRGKGVPPRSPQQPVPPPRRLHGTETVLVVEDEPAVRSVIIRTLHRHGFATIECANGPEALDILASEVGSSVHLLLTDVVMPGMSGNELIEHARSLSTELPILLMSGYTETELDANEPYLSKPFTGEQLVARIRQTLDFD